VVRVYVSSLTICRCGCRGHCAVTRPSGSTCGRSGAAESPACSSLARDARRIDTHAEALRLPDSALEPIDWNALDGWQTDDHAAAFATFPASCRPLLHTSPPQGEKRPMYLALTHACRQAVAAGRLAEERARIFFERNFRPLRISKLGESAGLLTGYYEPIVDGSRFPTGNFKVPIYRRPPDLVPPRNSAGPGFPNRGQSLRQMRNAAPGRRNHAAHQLRCPQWIP
jgi:membrane-bound lytic murein transglycosylase